MTAHKSTHERNKTSENAHHQVFAGLPNSVLLAGIVALSAGIFIVATDPAPYPKPASQMQGHAPSGMPRDDIALPESLDSLIAIGHTFYDQGNFSMSAEAYGRALLLDESLIDIRTDYGASLHAMGMPQRALDEFRTVLKSQPNHAIALFNMGVVFRMSNMGDSARFYWTRTMDAAGPTPLRDSAAAMIAKIDSK